MYTAPQVLRNRGKSYEEMAPYGPMCDVWSAAVTLYYLIYAKWPFSKNQILSWASPKSTVDWEKVKYPKSASALPPRACGHSCACMQAQLFHARGQVLLSAPGHGPSNPSAPALHAAYMHSFTRRLRFTSVAVRQSTSCRGRTHSSHKAARAAARHLVVLMSVYARLAQSRDRIRGRTCMPIRCAADRVGRMQRRNTGACPRS